MKIESPQLPYRCFHTTKMCFYLLTYCSPYFVIFSYFYQQTIHSLVNSDSDVVNKWIKCYIKTKYFCNIRLVYWRLTRSHFSLQLYTNSKRKVMLILIFISSQENKTNKNIIMCTMNYNISNVLARHARYESELSEKSEQKCGPRVLNYSEGVLKIQS